MGTIALSLPVARDSPGGGFLPGSGYMDEMNYLTSDELYSLIEKDIQDVAASGLNTYQELDAPGLYEPPPMLDKNFCADWTYKCSLGKESASVPLDCSDDLSFFEERPITDELSILVNPRTLSIVKYPLENADISEMLLLPESPPKPYHPSHDHDYFAIREDDETSTEQKPSESSQSSDFGFKPWSNYVDEMKIKDEPVVEVWEIDNFHCKEPPATVQSPEKKFAYRQSFEMETTRRKSARTADLRRREQARKISNAVHAVLKNEKAQRTRQYKSIKPKNSVETTPSQSDIDEWCSQPVRPTCSKITKKKTSKGRIDHSESERQRREVLRRNFSSLSDLIPNKYLRGEKVTSQISKQKILNGAKAFIVSVLSGSSSYKSVYHQNQTLRECFQKRVSKLKYVKWQK